MKPNIVDEVYLNVLDAVKRVQGVRPPLVYDRHLSDQHDMHVWIKKEYDAPVGSYKWRGALNAITYHAERGKKEFICASAGNHAQGFAAACKSLGVHGTVVMPENTAERKIHGTKNFGGSNVTIELAGDRYDQAFYAATKLGRKQRAVFIHAFDNPLVVAGQGTIAHEMYQHWGGKDSQEGFDAILVPVGGGGAIAGIGAYYKIVSPKTKMFGIESTLSDAMAKSLESRRRVRLPNSMSTFLEGTAVEQVGKYNFRVAKEVIDDIILVDEGQVCYELLQYHETEGDLIELAAAEGLAALHHLKGFKGKNVGVILTGKNANIGRMNDVITTAKHWQDIERQYELSFSQREGALKEFVNGLDEREELPNITSFHYDEVSGAPFAPVNITFKVHTNGSSAKVHWQNLEQALKELEISFERKKSL